MLKLHLITLLFGSISVSYAVPQQFTIYTELNCTGDGLILESKQENLVPEAPRIISNSKSFSTIGLWNAFDKVNFTGGRLALGSSESPICFNGTQLRPQKSIRYLGPPDTRTSSISLYENVAWVGREITITTSTFVNIPFAPKSLFSTGSASWTLYSGAYLNGNAVCFTPSSANWFDFINPLNSTLSNIKSVAQGCNRSNNRLI